MHYELIDSYPFYVEPFHVDFRGNIFLSILGNHMLNAAGNHSQKRGWGIATLNESQHTWVLSRLSIEMNEMPRQYEHCEVRTWMESVKRYFTNRNFSIHRADGTPLGYARSVWAMIDLETRKPCDLLTLFDGDILNYVTPEDHKEPYSSEGGWKEAVCPIEGHGRFRFRDPEHLRTIDTHYSDVDINGHVNSMKYIEHILDLFPRERFEQQQVRRIEIAYKAESYFGDRLSFYSQPVSNDETDIEVRKQTRSEADGTTSQEQGETPSSPASERNEEVVCQAKVCFKD